MTAQNPRRDSPDPGDRSARPRRVRTASRDLDLFARVDAAVLERNATVKGDEVQFRCPRQDRHRRGDIRPSASWNRAKWVWYCRACNEGGTQRELARLLGLPPALRQSPKSGRARGHGSSVSAATTTVYVLRDHAGNVVAEHRRHDAPPSLSDAGAARKKTFTFWRDGRPGLAGLSVEDLPLYGVEALSSLPDGSAVVVTEGEKAGDALRSRDLLAVGTATGAAKAPSVASLCPLARLDVVLWPDNDDPGRSHMERLAGRLREAGAQCVRQVSWTAAPPKGDAADFFELGGTVEEVRALIEGAAPVVASASRTGKLEIQVRNELTTVADEAETALVADPKSGIFVRARMLVRVLRDGTRARAGVRPSRGQPVIAPLTKAALRDQLDRSASWWREGIRGGEPSPALPPPWVVDSLLERGEWSFPRLQSVVETPTVRPDGTILDRPGYDEDTGLLYEPSAEFPPMPQSPTLADARLAAESLLDPFRDFPFVGDSSRAAVLAAVLTCIARPAIDGPVPLFAIRAPGPGTGKGLLVEAISGIATGRSPSLVTHASDSDEMRKRITSVAVEGLPLVLVDNFDGVFGSSVFAAALTAREWSDRFLGVSKIVTAPLRTVWFVTGNNLRFGATLGRRVVPIDLDAKLEHPEDRRGFVHPKLFAHILDARPVLVVKALTILRAYVDAGRPGHGNVPMGSFEAWDGLVRGCCVWVGAGDPAGADNPLTGRGRIRDEADEDLDSLRALLTALHDAFGTTSFTVAGAMAKGPTDPDLLEALRGVALTKKETMDGRSVGNAFRSFRGRIAGGLSLEIAGRARAGVKTWRVVGQDESPSSPVASERGLVDASGVPSPLRPEGESPRPTRPAPVQPTQGSFSCSPATADRATSSDTAPAKRRQHAEDCDCVSCIHRAPAEGGDARRQGGADGAR